MSQVKDDHQTVFIEKSEEVPPKSESVEGNPKKTSMGLDENVAGLCCYIFGFITGLIFLFLEKESRFVRFHALQAIFTTIALFILNIALTFIPILGVLVGLLLAPIGFLLWLFLMYQAYKGKYYKLPFIGDIAEKQLKSN